MKSKALLFNGLFAVVFFLLSSSVALSQSYHTASDKVGLQDQRWVLRMMGGPSVFLGDIKQNPLLPASTPFNEWRFGGSVGLEYRISPVFSLSGKAAYLQLAGIKTKNNRYFEADLIEGAIQLQIYPVNIFSLSNGRIAEFYLFGGFGLSNYDSRLYNTTNDQTVASSGFGNGKGIAGKTFEPVVAAGIGLDFPLSEHWMISFESGNHAVASDMLDVFASGFEYDVFNFTTVGVAYRFGSTLSGRRKVQPLLDKRNEEAVTDFIEPQIEKPVVQEEDSPAEGINQVITLQAMDTVPVIDSTRLVLQQEAMVAEIQPQPMRSGYRVQLLATSKPYDVSKLSAKTGLEVAEIDESTFNKLYIYVTGWFADRQSAIIAMKQIRTSHATPDAFIVYFSDGERVAKLP